MMPRKKEAHRNTEGDQPRTFRMPAEWEPHEATWLGWPHERTDWPGKFAPIPWAFAEIVRHLARVERVILLVEDAAAASAKKILRKSGADLDAITFLRVPTDRGWMRDSGPIGVLAEGERHARSHSDLSAVILRRPGQVATGATKNPSSTAESDETKRDSSGQKMPLGMTMLAGGARNDKAFDGGVLLNFAFNAWAKYDDYKKDARVVERATNLLAHAGPVKAWGLSPAKGRRNLLGFSPGCIVQPEHNGRRVVLEGGSIDVNGRGSLLTTEECLLSSAQSRNPGFTKDDYAEIFRRYLGVTNILWLGNGIAGDDTHGHVDDLARFVDERTAVTVCEEDPADSNYEPLRENLARLREMRDRDGCALRVETLPMPEPVWFDGQRLPASYANFYIANEIVLVPVFNDPADRIALEKLAALFPSRRIVPIYCRDLVLGLGAIHCMTQQLPRIRSFPLP